MADFSLAEAAEELRCKERWLRDHYREFRRREYGREVSFTPEDLDLIRAACAVDPTAGVLDASPVPSLADLRPATRVRRSA
ncbi:hypothetical protein AQ490_23355 [Wenjunlia vitaminophila]|uniref:Uncharacterized protein n=1 Tax=Wenjunlia vitaminophila TaxID=76728 RepID=A0A0T6LS34_WENVI|nr:hypothetical protein [Wenjunlia vitaminophila]KRV48808.1 hypothetical protein AQ490_23355 [Wenjunlia vitaminophila]